MNSPVEINAPFGSTSAGGAMRSWPRESVLVGAMLAGLGTSAGPAFPVDLNSRPQAAQQTTAGASIVLVERVGAAVSELRRLSGFTWDQLSRLFGVSCRSLHFWASGKAMTPANEEHLQRSLAVMRQIDRGTASANRAELFAPRDGGTIPFDLLAEGQYDHVTALLGQDRAPRRFVTPGLSDDALATRVPRPPEELVGAAEDRVQVAGGRLLASKPIRNPRRG